MTAAKIAVIGGGSWGATLADVLARNDHDVAIWEYAAASAGTLKTTRTLKVMPQLRLHPSVAVTNDLAEALKGRPAVVNAVPSEHVRKTWSLIRASGGYLD